MAWTQGHKLQEGRYTIDRILGQGGFGVTYLAWDNRRADWVVIKTLNDAVQADQDFAKFQQDFMNEALRLAMCSRHPHVVKVDQVILEDDLWCIVMEHISGETLLRRIKRRGPLAEAEALLYTRQIGDALVMLHEQDILHRDVKPANVLLRQARVEAVLIDFGLARDFSQGLIQHHTSWGTDGYAPIEQYDSLRRRGACIDVYALAATLYTMVTREVPLCAPVRATGRMLEPPQLLNPTLSERTNQAILTGMAFQAEDRPQLMQEWLDLLPPTGEFEAELGITTQDLQDLEAFLDHEAQELIQEPALNSGPTTGIDLDAPDPEAEQPTRIASTQVFIPTVVPDHMPLSRPLKDMSSGSTPVNGTQPTAQPDPYQPLRDLLLAGEWRKADQETTRCMLALVGHQREGYFPIESIEAFPCSTLRQLDQLWRQYSHDRFGFRVQYQILSHCGRDNERFGEQVGWKIRGRWLHYHQLLYDIKAPKGHLPVGFLAGSTGGMRSALLILDRYIFNKFKACL